MENEIIKLGEGESLFMESFVQVNEIMGYIKHGDEHIATNGSHYYVGMDKDEKGFYKHDTSAVFDHVDKAKAFIDGGKTGQYSTIGMKSDTHKALNGKPVLQPHERKDLYGKLGIQHESFIDAIVSKQNLTAESMFKAAMAQKVAQALDARRIEIAQTLYQRATAA